MSTPTEQACQGLLRIMFPAATSSLPKDQLESWGSALHIQQLCRRNGASTGTSQPRFDVADHLCLCSRLRVEGLRRLAH